jgi:hypothetical protein
VLLSRVGSVCGSDEHNSAFKIFGSFSKRALSVQDFVLGSDIIYGTFFSSEDGINKFFSELEEVR